MNCPRCGEPMTGGICNNCGFPMNKTWKRMMIPVCRQKKETKNK